MNTQPTHGAVLETLRAAPPITVGGLTLFGSSLEDWVLILTALYTVLQIGFLIRDKVWRHYGRNKRSSR